MIRNFIRQVLGRNKTLKNARLEVIPVGVHGITRDLISRCALRVTDQLQEAGFEAFVVGGAVRDLLLGRHPKDFDVATNATPEEVRRVIRRSRIIGRRFQIVHALCHDEVVEVTTFRGLQTEADDDQAADEHGRLIRDNVFGSQEEDALRRDFTANALFYDPHTEEVWDYFEGVRDIRDRRLRMIGEPSIRYREDPVRMLRAVRFAGKLGFSIDRAAEKPLRDLAPLLAHVPSSRLFDEMLKLLLSGHALDCLRSLRERDLHHDFLPYLDEVLKTPVGQAFIDQLLKNTDQRLQEDKPVSPGFLFAALLWFPLKDDSERRIAAGELPIPALYAAMDEVLETQRARLAVPRRFDPVIKEIWALQSRFLQRSGVRPTRLLEHPRFRAAYDFYLLRAEVGDALPEVAQWWTDFQVADEETQASMLVEDEKPKRRRRRPRKKSTRETSPE
jgi:poly(A) polymerase